MNSSLFQKSNVMYLSKEATSQDSSLKTQLLLSTGDKKNWDRKIWNKTSFFGDQSTDLTINKLNFPENTLVYINQGSVTPLKGKLAIYLEYLLVRQLIPAMNNPENIEEYECLPNEVK